MSDQDKAIRPKTAEQFFAEMYRDLRQWNREVPESPERADPILRIMLQLYAHQLATIDERVVRTWEIATSSLIKSVIPEARRWPVPAVTVMRCQPVDPVVEVDPHTRFYYKEKREGGQTFFFSSHRRERLLSAEVKHLLLFDGRAAVDLANSPEHVAPAQTLALSPGHPGQIYIGIEYQGFPSAFADAAVFLKAEPDILRQLRWGQWLPGKKSGFASDGEFCPGVTSSLESMFSESDREPVDWGGFRSSAELFGDLQDNWVRLSEKFAALMETGVVDPQLRAVCERPSLTRPVDSAPLYWIRVDLAGGGDKKKWPAPLDVFFNCFVVTNKNELTVFKHTGGNPLVEVELPEAVESLVGIESVVDSNGEDYVPRHRLRTGRIEHTYTVDERDGRLVLWFDFGSLVGPVPDSIKVTYTTTAGVAANGIAEGKIVDLYEKHPGVSVAANITPVRGAVPAKTDEQLVTEVSARLRNRDRALTFPEIGAWARTFDSRILQVDCRNGIERTRQGVRRCIVVRAAVGREEIYSDEEAQILARRVARFLKSRAPVNTHFQVEIVKR